MTRFKEYNINNSQLSRTSKPHHNGAHNEMTKLWENQSAWSSPEGEAVCNWNDFLSQQWPSGKSLWVFNRKEEPQSYPSWPTKSTRAQCSVWDASRTRSYSSGLGGILRAVQAMDVTCHELLYQMVRIWGLVPCWEVLSLADTFLPSPPCPFSATLGKHTILISEARAQQDKRVEKESLSIRDWAGVFRISHKHSAGDDKGWKPVFAWWWVKG